MLRRFAAVPLGLVTILVVGAAAALVMTAQGPLDERRDAVDARWTPLRAPLATRYERLGELASALDEAGAGARSYTIELTNEIRTWQGLAGRTDGDPGAEAASANRLEGLAQRIQANVARSARLGRATAVVDALAAFSVGLIPAADVESYNRAVRRYQSTRSDLLKRLPAEILGFGVRPLLVLGGPTPG